MADSEVGELWGKSYLTPKNWLPTWNAVSVAFFTVLAGILTGYVASNCHKITLT